MRSRATAVHPRVHTHKHKPKHTQTHACTRERARARARTHARTHTHTHTHTHGHRVTEHVRTNRLYVARCQSALLKATDDFTRKQVEVSASTLNPKP